MAGDAAATHDANEETTTDSHANSPRFAAYFKVRHYEMDALGHVNNAVYLHYLEQAAYEHSAAAGFSDEQTRALGGIWIVRKHEIEYLRPATAGDVLQVVTWAVEFKGARAFRDYAIFRYDGPASNPHGIPADRFLPPDQSLPADPLVRARTLWVWADLLTARPRRIPLALYPAFFAATETD
ncbi:MAG: acyl-CoA thioesterase [Chloroflexota bacterium]|nr:acyl-CoA thioesterase [Chloroflexota bacterium]